MDDVPGCEDCLSKSVNPQLAWDAFYRDGKSLRDSFCIGRRCKREKEVGDDLNKNSSLLEECPLLPADSLPPPSPCLSPGWGAHLPSSILQIHPLPQPQAKQNLEMWRPWETGCSGSAGKIRGVLRSEAGEDHNYSLECPSLLSALAFVPPPLSTPAKPSFSVPFFSSQPPRRMLVARKRKRSLGELVKRRQRHLSYQLSQTTPSSPCLEPEQSTLESGDRLNLRSLDSFPAGDWTPSWLAPSQNMPTSSPYLPKSSPYLPTSSPEPSPYLPTSSPGPCPPTPCLSSNMAPPSPVYCDGCHRWGNLLTVTVSQTRPP